MRDIAAKAMDALHYAEIEDAESLRSVAAYLKTDYQRLQELWNERHEGYLPTYLGTAPRLWDDERL